MAPSGRNIPGPRYLTIVTRPSNVNAVTVRAAEPLDADAIVRVFLESARYHAALDPERYRVPEPADVLPRYTGRTLVHDADTITLVAHADGTLVGFVDARLEKSPDLMHRRIVYCHVSEIAVSGRYQRQGVGGQLLRAVEEWGRQRGAAFTSLEHHVANTRAAAFYEERMGYFIAADIRVKRL